MSTKSEVFWRVIAKFGVRIRNLRLFVLFFLFYFSLFLFFHLYLASIRSTVTQPSFVHNSCLVLTIVPSVVSGGLQVCFFFRMCVCVGERERDRLRARYMVMLYIITYTLLFGMMYTAEK